MEHVLAASPRQGAMLSSLKVAKPQTSRKRVPKVVTPNVTRALRSKGKFPKKPIVELPKRRKTKRATQSKGKEKEERNHEKNLEKENRYLYLQWRMTGHYKKLNQFSWRKLKATQEKLKEAQRRRPTPKMKKDTSKLKILASAS